VPLERLVIRLIKTERSVKDVSGLYTSKLAERVGFSAAFNSEGLRYWPVDFSSANGTLAHRSGSATVAP